MDVNDADIPDDFASLFILGLPADEVEAAGLHNSVQKLSTLNIKTTSSLCRMLSVKSFLKLVQL